MALDGQYTQIETVKVDTTLFKTVPHHFIYVTNCV